jgi:tetratricopeptide (TPR) repeat protein
MFTGGNIVPEEGRVPEQSYRAFISYSHRDDAIARTLHKRLETYRLPKHLIGSETPRGPLPKQLTPIFRDLDELSAADDLSAEIKAALARSEVLIILASPAAKASKWVNLEIETFRALHGNSRPVLVALIEGEPADAFPPALTAGGHEPVAADFRKSAPGGKRLALLKLVAGITAAPLDALVQRDAQRQYRRVMAITGGALTAVLVMALLLVVALRSQAEAQRQRQEAEGLVEYMLTDLRDKLKEVGRIDVMTAVNERAMRYYGGQGSLNGLGAESLNRRARIIAAMAGDDEARGLINPARQKYLQVHNVTAELLAKEPNNPERIFAHAQSENRIGLLEFTRKDYAAALPSLQRANQSLSRIRALPKKRNDWTKLASFVDVNICASLLKLNRDERLALRHCQQAVDESHSILSTVPDDSGAKYDLVFHLMWLGDAYGANAKASEARDAYQKSLRLVSSLVSSDPLNKLWLEQKMQIYVQMARSKHSGARPIERLDAISRAREIAMNLVKDDPSNAYWRENLYIIDSIQER